MRPEDLPATGFTDNEMMLIAEAVRRACEGRWNVGIAREAIVEAVMAEARRGTRTMYGLVKVGWRVGQVRLTAQGSNNTLVR